jgi:hypothetical protein
MFPPRRRFVRLTPRGPANSGNVLDFPGSPFALVYVLPSLYFDRLSLQFLVNLKEVLHLRQHMRRNVLEALATAGERVPVRCVLGVIRPALTKAVLRSN